MSEHSEAEKSNVVHDFKQNIDQGLTFCLNLENQSGYEYERTPLLVLDYFILDPIQAYLVININ